MQLKAAGAAWLIAAAVARPLLCSAARSERLGAPASQGAQPLAAETQALLGLRRRQQNAAGDHQGVSAEDDGDATGKSAFVLALQQYKAFSAAEREALTAQEAALEALAAQEGALAMQLQRMQVAQNRTEAEVQHLQAASAFTQLGGVLAARAGLTCTVAALAARLALAEPCKDGAGSKATDEKSKSTFWPELGAVSVYVLLMVLCGFIYGQYFAYLYPSLEKMPEVSRKKFSFGLTDGCMCDPDWRICFFSFFCQPVRWADTAHKPRIKFLSFWPGLVFFSLFAALSHITLGITAVLLLAVAVLNRQRIREVYGLPHGSCASVCGDCLTWTFCGPCATMQEAMEVEFIDPALASLYDGAPPPPPEMSTTGRY